MSVLETTNFTVTHDTLFNFNTVYNLQDINNPIMEPAEIAPRFELYLVQKFNEKLVNLTTLDKFNPNLRSSDGVLVPPADYGTTSSGSISQINVLIENGKMANNRGFTWIVTGLGHRHSEDTLSNTITIQFSEKNIVGGYLIVYNTNPNSNIYSNASSDLKYIVAATTTSSIDVNLGVPLTISILENNLLTIAETTCDS